MESRQDDSGTLGLAYTSIAGIYELQQQDAKADRYYRLALASFVKSKNTAYLPVSYIKIGGLLLKKNQKSASLGYYEKALALGKQTKNKEAEARALLALGNWHLHFDHNLELAKVNYSSSLAIAKGLQDKSFEIKTLEAMIVLQKAQGNYPAVSQLQESLLALKEQFYTNERQQIEKHLEVQFEVSEQNRKLKLISAEQKVSTLTNYLLLCLLALVILAFSFLYYFMKRSSTRDKQLLRTKEALVALMEEQKY